SWTYGSLTPHRCPPLGLSALAVAYFRRKKAGFCAGAIARRRRAAAAGLDIPAVGRRGRKGIDQGDFMGEIEPPGGTRMARAHIRVEQQTAVLGEDLA